MPQLTAEDRDDPRDPTQLAEAEARSMAVVDVNAASDAPPSMYWEFDKLPLPDPAIERLGKALTEAVQSKRAADAALEEAKLAHAKEVLGLRSELERMRSEQAEQQAAHDAVSAALEAENSRLTRKLDQRSQEADSHRADEAYKELESTITQLKKQCSAASANIAHQNTKLGIVEVRAIAAEAQVKKLVEQLFQLREEHASTLRTSAIEIETVERRHRATTERAEKTRSSIETLTAENRTLINELDAVRTAHLEYQEATARKWKEAQQQSQTLAKNAAMTAERLDEAKRNLGTLEGENTRLRSREQELEDALADVVCTSPKSDAVSSSVRTALASPTASSAKLPFETPQRSELQRTEHIAQLIFEKFDTDNDGYHSLDESRALARTLIKSDVSESDFESLCRDLGANLARGVNLQQFTTIYTDAAFDADAERDYKTIFGKQSPQ